MADQPEKAPQTGYTKGTGPIFVRNLLEKKGLTQTYLSRLTTERAKVFTNLIPLHMVPDAEADYYFQLAAEIMYPNDPKGLAKLGIEQARTDLTGIYKFFMAIASVDFVINKTATLWKTYHTRGLARVVKNPSDKKKIQFIVENFPDLSASVREVISGYIQGVTEQLSVKNVKIQHDAGNSQAWSWMISWE